MPSSASLPSPENDYASPIDAVLNKAFWDAALVSVGARIRALEAVKAGWEELINEGTGQALAVIQANIEPQLAALTAIINQLKADVAVAEDAIAVITTGGIPMASVVGLNSALALKASIAYVDTAIANLVAAALGNDADFATTVTKALSEKVSLSELKSDGTPNAPVKYDANGGFSVRWLNISQLGKGAQAGLNLQADAGQDTNVNFYQGGALKFQLAGKADGTFGLWDTSATQWAWIVGLDNVVAFDKAPKVAGAEVVVKDGAGRLPAIDGSRLTNLNAFGIGQAVYDVKASRSPNVVYQNPSDKPMFLGISITAANGSTGSYTLFVGSTSSPNIAVGSVGSTNGSTQNFSVSTMVPPKGYYTFNGGGPAIIYWSEYR